MVINHIIQHTGPDLRFNSDILSSLPKEPHQDIDVSQKLATETRAASLDGRAKLLNNGTFTRLETSSLSEPDLHLPTNSISSGEQSFDEDLPTSPILSNFRAALGIPLREAHELLTSMRMHSEDSETTLRRVHKSDEGLYYGFHINGSQALLHNKSKLRGEGGFKNAWECLNVDINSGIIKNVVMAKPRKDKKTSVHAAQNWVREVEIHSKLKHENILQLLSYDIGNKTVDIIGTNEHKTVLSGSIFTESCDTDLYALMQNSICPLSPYENRECLQNTLVGASQSAAALVYMHEEHGLAHNDFKPDNIFLKNGRVKVGDFGLTASLDSPQKQGCLLLLAPEQTKETGKPIICSTKTDIFQFGLTMGYFVLKPEFDDIFNNDTDQNLLGKDEFRKAISHLSEYISGDGEEIKAFKELAHIIEQCVKTDPADRPSSMREIREAIDNIARRFPANQTPRAFETRSSSARNGVVGIHNKVEDCYKTCNKNYNSVVASKLVASNDTTDDDSITIDNYITNPMRD